MMKKHNEGYTLVLVMVVILVLLTFSLAITSFSLHNLKNQMASADRLAAKYAAQGEVEKILGQLSTEKTLPFENGKTEKEILEAHLESICGDQADDFLTITEGSGDDEKTLEASLKINLTANAHTVTCELELSGTVCTEKDAYDVVTGYALSAININYTSYEIGGAA